MAKIPKVTESNEIVGETTITEAKEKGWPRRVARVFVLDTESQNVLLQKRSMSVHTHLGLWDCSGGHVDLGETYAEAGAREMQEELGVTVSVKEMAEPVFLEHTFYVVCLAHIDKDTRCTFESDEVHEVLWVSVDVLHQLIAEQPEKYTTWFVHAWTHFHDKLISSS